MNELLQKAVAARNPGDAAKAEYSLLAALAKDPENRDLRYQLSMFYGEQNRPLDALRETSRALEADPEFAEGWFALCDFAERMGQFELSCFAGSHAVRLEPTNGAFWLRYGIALNRWGHNSEAIEAYKAALKIDPSLSSAWINLSVAFMNDGKALEAEQAARNGIEAAGLQMLDDDPEIDEARYGLPYWHLALAELAQGKYREGFAHLRARYKGSTDWKRFNDPRPLWRGEDLQGKTLLVRVEQGHGDAIMLARYLPLLKAKGARVLFQVHPALVSLFAREKIADKVLSIADKVLDGFDWHTTIFDLPHRFATTIDTIPLNIPYLSKPLPSRKTKINLPSFKVGLIWAGQNNPAHDRLRSRSVPLSELTPLFALKHIHFISLTSDRREGDQALMAQYHVTDMSGVIDNFSSTAEIMAQLDTVVTCDTATAHLAGAMGVKALTMLSSTPDWRWLMQGDTSPWYPSMRLVRQSTPGDWQPVIAEVKQALERISL